MSEQEVGRPKYTLPTERIAFDRQLEILRAYVSASGPQATKSVSNTEVGGMVKLNASTASLANPFMREARLIESADGGHIPTTYTIEYARAFQWEAESAGEKLAPALRESWFDQTVRPTLYIRPMSEDEALQKLADAASVGPKYKPQLKILLDYLQVAGLIRREGGQVLIGVEASGQQRPKEKPQGALTAQERAPGSYLQPERGGVNLDIHIHASMDEMKSWPPDRIAAFFAGIGAVLAAKGGSTESITD